MAIVVTHTCDRCGHAQHAFHSGGGDGPRVMRDIRLIVSQGSSAGNSVYDDRFNALWCQECIDETGVARRLKPGQKQSEATPDPEPTFEERLRELIREEVANAQS